MCQWGARGMAAAGASSREIIAFYFPATALGRG
jgi:peptidoglycan hydrolase-like amidase